MDAIKVYLAFVGRLTNKKDLANPLTIKELPHKIYRVRRNKEGKL